MSPTAEPAAALPVTRPARISPAQKVVLVVEVVRAYRRAHQTLSAADLPTTLNALRRGADAEGLFSDADYLTAKRLAGAVKRTLIPIPKRSKCLMQSLTLAAMLARRGIHSSVVIAVRSGEDFGAHAWVEYHGRPLLPTNRARFERLTEV